MNKRSLSGVVLCLLLMVGLTGPVSAAEESDIQAKTSDGRSVILHNDGSWEFVGSVDDGKILISITSMKTYTDSDGYEGCRIEGEVTNNTEYTLQEIVIFFWMKGKGTDLSGQLKFKDYDFAPGHTIYTDKDWSSSQDIICNEIDHFTVTADNGFTPKRNFRGKKFKDDAEADKFLGSLLEVSSQHDAKFPELRIRR